MVPRSLCELKDWLTVPEAARLLAQFFNEQVTEADILRLALDGRLLLSVYFVNHAKARRGTIVGFNEAEWGEFTAEQAAAFPDIPEDAKGKPLPYMKSLNIDGKRFINLSDDVTTITGVWDLPMIGTEQLDVEHRYQSLTGGPEVTLEGLDGAFVSQGDNVICQLQEAFDDNPFQQGSKAAGDELEQRIINEDIGHEESAKLRKKFKEERNAYLAYKRKQPAKNNYYPAGGLPNDGVFVIRSATLKKFKQSLAETSDREVTPRERDTLYKIIIGIAASVYNFDPTKQRSDVIANIVSDLDRAGVPVSDDTVRKYIKEAAQLLPRKSA